VTTHVRSVVILEADITKPVTLDGLVDVGRAFGRHWFEPVALPATQEARCGAAS